MARFKSITKRILLLLVFFFGFICYSVYLMINDYTPDKKTLEQNKEIVQKEIIKHNDSSKEFDEVIKMIEEKRNKPKQLEIEKQVKIVEEKEKLKQKEQIQKPQKKEQKMVRYEDWIDEPNEALPVEKLELEKIQWEGKPDER